MDQRPEMPQSHPCFCPVRSRSINQGKDTIRRESSSYYSGMANRNLAQRCEKTVPYSYSTKKNLGHLRRHHQCNYRWYDVIYSRHLALKELNGHNVSLNID